ncbi:MAG: hypothetical protein RO469_09965 [Thermincola sp.]|jgi:hypothetical protein|nr:hypothetical protein [Thermincola sp.]MDT3703919.1 hypothetical protein [Thermincola sp.]
MGHKLNRLLHVLVLIARDMLIGMISGLTAAILLFEFNPHTENFVALLIPTGIAAGILKGFSKSVILNAFSSLPTKGYRFNYPKYKLLLLWLGLLGATLLYAYGINFSQWFAAPHKLFRANEIFKYTGTGFWNILMLIVAVIGSVSYIYEPPCNSGEVMPTEETLE